MGAALHLVLQLAAEHVLDQAQAVEVGGAFHDQLAAVAQDGDTVGQREDLIEEVGDEDDPEPPVAQAPDHVEQHLHLPRVERGGRLVQDQHLARQRHRAGDGHDLLDGDRLVPEVPAHV